MDLFDLRPGGQHSGDGVEALHDLYTVRESGAVSSRREANLRVVKHQCITLDEYCEPLRVAWAFASQAGSASHSI